MQERTMALQAYMTINKNNISKGASTASSLGQVASSDTSHNDQITVVAFQTDCLIPRDPNSGVATGTRIYQPVTFTKYFDASSPLLWNALANNLGIDQVVCDFFRPDPTGLAAPQNFFRYTWKTVTFVEGKGYTPLVINSANSFFQYMEDWSFTFKSVQWDQLISSTTGSDQW
jgi:type VI secretion system secreted protein Hcp